MSNQNNEADDVLVQLRQEFIEASRDQIDDIEIKLDRLDSGQGSADEELLSIQRHIHNIKGQGATFGFPLTGRVAHMLEDYLKNADGIGSESIADIRVYLELMVDLISTSESIAEDDPQSLLTALPTGQVVTFSTQKTNDINVLLVMPSGLQRKMVAKELLSCGFRVMRAYDGLEALSIAADITPDIVFVNYDMTPFNGRELSNMFAAVDTLRDIHFVLLTSYDTENEQLQNLPDNVSVVEKRMNFTESIGELLIQWGMFGNIPYDTTENSNEIRQHPKAARVVKHKTRRPLSILIAEDNPINQQLIQTTIEAFGHQSEVAENGRLALEALKMKEFDLILMDVRMPEMSGPEATRAIRQLPGDISKIPVIAVTADGSEEFQKEYSEAGMDGCVGKPIDRAELLQAINKVMGEEIHVPVEVGVQENELEETGETSNPTQAVSPAKPDADVEDFMKNLQKVADKYDAQ
ncbi:MAG: response regulator [Rhodospirillales bacterium]|nr:response regulator [Rhodospirillales bacterium]